MDRTRAAISVAVVVVVILTIAVAALLGVGLWRVLDTYIDPTSPTQRKDLVQSFAVVVAGVVGSLSALAAVGNLYISRRNLQQQRILELERADREFRIEQERAQGDALPEYIERIIEMLSDKESPLRNSQLGDEVRMLARVRTLTVLPLLDGFRKRQVVEFLYESGLIDRAPAVVDLAGADLRGVDLRVANLHRADLIGADLKGADLEGAYLHEAHLEGANLQGAYATDEQLANAYLQDATMPNGQKYEDWLKDR